MVPYNYPLPLDKTIRRHSHITDYKGIPQSIPERFKKRLLSMANFDPALSDPLLSAWDQHYKERIAEKKCSVFLACRPLYLNLQNPPILRKEEMDEILGTKANQRTPPAISSTQFDKLRQICKIIYML